MGYLHGSDEAEQERLEAQARYLGGPDFLPALRGGQRVLDVGCGTGAIARDVAARVAPALVAGVDLRRAQVVTARRLAVQHGVRNLHFLCGDARALALPEASFDGAYARFVLEHAVDPPGVLAEMCRVVKPGGWVCAYEWEPGCFAHHPTSPAIDRVWQAIYKLQSTLGGDPWIGRKLYSLFSRADGLTDVSVEVRAWTVTAADSERLVPYVEADRQVLKEAGPGLLDRQWVSSDDLAQADADYELLVGSPEAFVTHGFGLAVGRRMLDGRRKSSGL